jgi:hypothetical protein
MPSQTLVQNVFFVSWLWCLRLAEAVEEPVVCEDQQETLHREGNRRVKSRLLC